MSERDSALSVPAIREEITSHPDTGSLEIDPFADLVEVESYTSFESLPEVEASPKPIPSADSIPAQLATINELMRAEARASEQYRTLHERLMILLEPEKIALGEASAHLQDARGELETTMRWHGVKTATSRDGAIEAQATYRKSMIVTDEDAALEHALALGRRDDIVEVKLKTTKVLALARELEKTDEPLRGVERISEPTFSIKRLQKDEATNV